MRLLELPDKNLILKGYSKSTNFVMRNAHPKLYVLFKVQSQPPGEFIVIPENGIIGPQETKQLKVYLSKISMHKEKLNNSYVQINADLKYRYNQTIAEEENIVNWDSLKNKTETIVLPVSIGNQYTQLKAGIQVPTSSLYTPPHQQLRVSPVVVKKEDSFNSSISMHSQHLIEDIKPIEAMKFQIKPTNIVRQASPAPPNIARHPSPVPPSSVNMAKLGNQMLGEPYTQQHMYPVSQKQNDPMKVINHAIDADIRRSPQMNPQGHPTSQHSSPNRLLEQAVNMDVWGETHKQQIIFIPPKIQVSSAHTNPQSFQQPNPQMPNNQFNPLRAVDVDLRNGTQTQPMQFVQNVQNSQQAVTNQMFNAVSFDRQMRESSFNQSPSSFRQPQSNILQSFAGRQELSASGRMQPQMDPMFAVATDIQHTMKSSNIRQNPMNLLPHTIGLDMRQQIPQRHRHQPLLPSRQPQSAYMDVGKLRARRNNLINQLKMLEDTGQVKDFKAQFVVMVLFIAIMITFGSYFRYF